MSAAIPLIPVELAQRQRRRRESAVPDLWALLDTVMDPEVPVLSLWELGVLQDVRREGDSVIVVLTPTYSGCPALEHMRALVIERLQAAGCADVRVTLQLAPAWSSSWIGPRGRAALRKFGIAPPGEPVCPRCGQRRPSS
ncbi:MAG: 1,2-phenylacetyl-CoA epoxidase subunit PaaD [Pseudomonadales bacterium]